MLLFDDCYAVLLKIFTCVVSVYFHCVSCIPNEQCNLLLLILFTCLPETASISINSTAAVSS